MPEPEKPGRDRAGDEESGRKSPMFSHKGLVILVVALLMEAVVAAFLARAVGGTPPGDDEDIAAPRKEQILLIKKEYVDLDGPTFSVRVAPNTYQTVRVRYVRIEIDPDLDEKNFNNLKQSIENLGYEIKQSLQEIIEYEGHDNLLVPQKRQRLQNKLRQEIIRMLGVSDKEVKAVIYDDVQVVG